MKRLLLFLLSSLFLLIFNLPSVYACSGGGEYVLPTVDTMLAGELLVRGRVIENSGGNSIIEVERYLQGSGSRFLFLYRNSPEWYHSNRVRDYDYGCAYAESAVGEVGMRAYFSLSRSNIGNYGISTFEHERMFSIVEDIEGETVYYWEMVNGVEEQRFASIDEFEAMIAERTGNAGTVPDEDSAMPRFRVLTITTESGQTYQLPLDRDEIYPIQVTNTSCTENCPILSPDRTHYLNPVPNEANAYWAWYRPNSNGDDWSDGIGEGEGIQHPPMIRAETVLFSPDSDFLLGWYEGSISVYAFNTWRDSGFYGYLPTLTEVWSAQLAVTDTMTAESFNGLAAWSGNSNAIVYWDADGLKWMDISMMYVPRLILPHESEGIRGFAQGANSEAMPPLLELSNTGRYLRYGQVDEWTLLDILSGTEFDDMLVNPDETAFVSFAPEVYPSASINTEEGECAMFDSQGNCLMTNQARYDFCLMPMATCTGSFAKLYEYQLREVHWRDNTNIVYLACEYGESNICFARQVDIVNYNYAPERPESFVTNAFAYDEHYGYVAWATDDSYLRLNANSYDDALDLSAVLDSPIVGLEWAAPMWYLGEEE